MSDYSREREVVRALMVRAEALVLSHYGKVETELKAGNEPVTIADRETNALIVDGLKTAFPDDGILAEESPVDDVWHTRARLWCVDPIDGTKEFLAQNGEFAVMIGLAVDGRAAMGWVLLPAHRKLFIGGPGLGATVENLENGEVTPLTVSDTAATDEMTLAVSRSHRSEAIESMERSLGITRELKSGSVGVKLGLIAEGRADLYIHPSLGTKRWDACGPEAVIAGAGGLMTDCYGEPIRYDSPEVHNRAGLLASNGTGHADIIERIRPQVEAAFAR